MMMDTSRAVIVILNYNDWQTTKRLIDKISGYEVLHKIVVVDNQSSDDSYQRLKELESEKIEVLTAPSNGGYAKGNNFGVQYAIKKYASGYIFIANPDILFEETAAKKMIGVLKKESHTAVAAPLVNQGYNVWRQPGFWGILEALLLVTFNLDKRNIKRKLLTKKQPQEVGVVEGSFFLIRAKAYEDVNGFDERTFLYCEENILGYRLKEKGYRTVVLPDCSYEHLHSQSIKKEFKSKTRAFKHFHQSFRLYLREYVKTNPLQNVIFEVVYGIGYVERKLYDLLK